MKKRRQPPAPTEVLTPEMLLKVVEKVVERHFGHGMYERLLQYIRTRCEEDNCSNEFETVCMYCGLRVCGRHAVDYCGITYCRLHADHRLFDIYLVRRDL